MACDIVLMDKNDEIETMARRLGFSKVFFNEDIKKLGIKEVKDYWEKRKIIEGKQIKVLLNPHLVNAKDSLHFRNSGLDHVLCGLMSKNNIVMGISLDKITNYVEIGRVMQNIMLCRKYKVKMIFFSFADNLYDLRSRLDTISFLRILGMTPGEARGALEF